MQKKASTSRQPQLISHNFPELPDGNYSSGPNPNLRNFILHYLKPYNPETDRYKVAPFNQPITTTKATAIYNMHTYWSKKPHDAIRQYIRHYTKPGDIVLDPFCGSGGTALAALMETRVAVAIDLSPAATFITKNYCTPINITELQKAFDEIEAIVKPEMYWLYETRCDRCDGRASTVYTVYSYVFECPRCLEKVPLFDCQEVKNENGKVINACPFCYERGITEEISTRSKRRFEPIPVMVKYRCLDGCKGEQERRHNDQNDKKRQFFQKYDIGKIEEINQQAIPHWIPKVPMIKGYETTVKRNLEKQGVRTVDDLFTKRNLRALAAILSAAKKLGNKKGREVLVFALTALLLRLTRMNQYRPDVSYPTSIISGTYYIPQVSVEANVWHHYPNKVERLEKGYEEINRSVSSNQELPLLVSTQSAKSMEEIPSNSIDYIFTDPPYSGNVQYGELNYVWEAWLGMNLNWLEEEVIVNQVRGKTEADWAIALKTALAECYRVLKPGRWISLCYHDTSEGTWQLLQDVVSEVGFLPENLKDTLFIDTGGKTYNQNIASKVTKRDLIINYRKPYPGEINGQMYLFGDSDFETFQEAAKNILSEVLTHHPGTSADRLYDEIVSRTVRKGQFERHNFDTLIRSVAEESPKGSGRWYLLTTSGQVDEAESAKEEAAATRLEKFIQTFLKENLTESGVHYSDLFEQYLPVVDKPRRLLQDWLPEFFYKTADGTWRPPLTDEERKQKAALRSSGALRRIKRFANALLEGVPPYEKDRPDNAATLADWIRQCRRAGLYELGRVLYEKGGLRFDGLGEEAQLEVDEDYQVCVRRSEKTAPKKTKGNQPNLLED